LQRKKERKKKLVYIGAARKLELTKDGGVTNDN